MLRRCPIPSRSPSSCKRRLSYRKIAAELAARGHVTGSGSRTLHRLSRRCSGAKHTGRAEGARRAVVRDDGAQRARAGYWQEVAWFYDCLAA